MLVFIKLVLCVMAVEVGVTLIRRLAGVVSPPRVEASPQPLRVTVRPPPRPARRPAPAPVPEGVELAAVDVQPVGAQCRVCANAIEGQVASCEKCEAPHHEDCWEYNGGCATYGCRSGVARPAG